MIRKLIQLSPSTAVVSLPSDWVHKNKLKKGTALSVTEQDNKVLISAGNQKNEKEITLDVSLLAERIFWAYLAAAYEAGYDSIIFLTKDQKQSAFVSKTSKWFPGMIVYEERKNKVQFKDLAEDQPGELDKVLSRVFNMCIALVEDALEAIQSKDWETLKQMKLRDYTINSYISYCQRQLSKFGFSVFSKTGSMHTYLKLLEMLSDKVSGLFVVMGEKKAANASLAESLLKLYRLFQRMHFNYSQDKLLEVEELRKKLGTIRDLNLVSQVKDLMDLWYALEEVEMQFQV